MDDQSDKGLENLLMWQKAINFATKICKDVLPRLPLEEKWALAGQLRRSAQSIPANIAEGHGRFYYQDNVRFCYIARGSLDECLSHLTLAKNLGYINEQNFLFLKEDIRELNKMLHGYIAYLKASKRGASEPGSTLTVREDSSIYLTDFQDPMIAETLFPDNIPPNYPIT